jgi:hypothetical protein
VKGFQNILISTKRKEKFPKMSEIMEGVCFVLTAGDLAPNTGKDDVNILAN